MANKEKSGQIESIALEKISAISDEALRDDWRLRILNELQRGQPGTNTFTAILLDVLHACGYFRLPSSDVVMQRGELDTEKLCRADLGKALTQLSNDLACHVASMERYEAALKAWNQSECITNDQLQSLFEHIENSPIIRASRSKYESALYQVHEALSELLRTNMPPAGTPDIYSIYMLGKKVNTLQTLRNPSELLKRGVRSLESTKKGGEKKGKPRKDRANKLGAKHDKTIKEYVQKLSISRSKAVEIVAEEENVDRSTVFRRLNGYYKSLPNSVPGI